jgi:MFS family permease
VGLIRIASAENNNNKNVKTSALLIVALGSFLVPFMGSSLSIALPLIQKDLSVNIILLGWIPTAFVLANAAFLLPFGRLADIHGRKKIFTYGVIIYTIASFLAALSPSAIYLIMGSFLQGMGCALIFATGVALLSSVYPSNHRGEVFGFFVTAVYVGLFLGPLLGGFLAQNLGWRSIFLFNVPFGLLLLTLILWKLKGEWFGSKNGVFDLKGTIIYIPSLIAILYGFSTLQSNLGQVIFIAGIIGVLIFILQEIRSFNPILKLKEYRSRTSSFSALALLLMNISTTALWTLLSLYLQDLLSLGPQITAIIISVEPLMVAIFSPPVGRLSDHMDNRILSATGMAITSIGLLILSFLNVNKR